MEPKFQSSFIPKGPIASSGVKVSSIGQEKNLIGVLGTIIFVIAILASAGVFGYNKYLSYKISQTGKALDEARQTIDVQSIKDLMRLDARLNSSKVILENHVVASPIFDFLEISTLKSVRFTEFNLQTTNRAVNIRLNGRARNYAAVALQSDLFSKSNNFSNPIFSDLSLDEEGNVMFTFNAKVNPEVISYKKMIERTPTQITTSSQSVSTSTATSTPTATSTKKSGI